MKQRKECCDPCPKCGAPVEVEEVSLGSDDYYWEHSCTACDWNDE